MYIHIALSIHLSEYLDIRKSEEQTDCPRAHYYTSDCPHIHMETLNIVTGWLIKSHLVISIRSMWAKQAMMDTSGHKRVFRERMLTTFLFCLNDLWKDQSFLSSLFLQIGALQAGRWLRLWPQVPGGLFNLSWIPGDHTVHWSYPQAPLCGWWGETPPGMSLSDLLVTVGRVRRGVSGKGDCHHAKASNLNWAQLPILLPCAREAQSDGFRLQLLLFSLCWHGNKLVLLFFYSILWKSFKF